MTKHLTSFEDSAVDVAKIFEDNIHEISVAARDSGRLTPISLLGRAVEQEILPRLLGVLNARSDNGETTTPDRLDDAAITAFVALIVDDDVEQLRAVADRFILYTGGRDALLHQLLTPAARLLGRMWEDDACDFITVTLGVCRLNQIMRETESDPAPAQFVRGFDHRVLLLPAPGEQHSFGVTMVADAFRGAGWCVRSAPLVSRRQLLGLVKDEWFDVVGLSVSSERCLKGLPSCIRAVRAASCNPRTYVMLGGYAINCHPERSRFLGADSIAEDASKALLMANKLMEHTVTERFGQFNTELSDVSLVL